jgi:hypothetical protein
LTLKNKLPFFGLMAAAFLMLTTSHSGAQPYGYFQPRFTLGGSAAEFRISLDEFENIYQSRWGASYGGFVGVRVFSAHYALFKYATFQKGGKKGILPETGLDLQNAKWDEQWYSIGLRVQPPILRKIQSYYGFGVAFFDVDEQPGLSVFQDQDENGLGTGFYLELGLEYFPMQKASAFFELEVASGGTRGKTGFEAFSVGGFRFALGLTLWPF